MVYQNHLSPPIFLFLAEISAVTRRDILLDAPNQISGNMPQKNILFLSNVDFRFSYSSKWLKP